jgi:hypothetical protein
MAGIARNRASADLVHDNDHNVDVISAEVVSPLVESA